MISDRKPELIIFAGPNGSGKTSISKHAGIIGPYVNADEIKIEMHCSDIEAAKMAASLRNEYIDQRKSFTMETVLSTTQKIELIKKAKRNRYFIICIYVITDNYSVNIQRVLVRHEKGGHDVPYKKIISRYARCLDLIPEVNKLSDVFYLYDNTLSKINRIAMKKRNNLSVYPNSIWPQERIKNLLK